MTQPTDESEMPKGAIPTLLAAIVRERTVTATYNRGAVTLAPHVLYTRHDALHLDAITLQRDGRPPREVKLATYKLDGLGDIRLAADGFRPSALFTPAAERYVGVTLMAVERG